MLRTLNRLHEVVPGARVEGKVLLDGQDIYAADVDPVNVRRTIGMVFQRPNPFPTMSIYDNVIAGLRLEGRRRRGRTTTPSSGPCAVRTSGTRSRTGCSVPAPGCPAASSSGCASPAPSPCSRRCCSWTSRARRSTRSPRTAIEDLIGTLKEQYTIVIVTHNMQQAARVSDTTAFFNLAGVGKPGRLIEVAPTQQIFSNPAEQATEDYISGRFG